MYKIPYQTAKEDDVLEMKMSPGYLSVVTDRMGQGRWKDGNLVRFATQSGLPTKVGGWAQQSAANLYSAGLLGVCRGICDWRSLDRQYWSAFGTNSKLYIFNQGTFYDITPSRRQVNLSNPFTTINGQAQVTVTDANHGAAQGDYVQFSGATAVGGLTINGEYQIGAVTLNTYVITAASAATSGATGGGTHVLANYDISAMSASNTQALGWGAGTWSQGTWGTPRGSSNIFNQIGFWSLDNWGEDLIASPRNGTIYTWKHSTGPFAKATAIPGAPSQNYKVMVITGARQVVAFGSSASDSSGNPTGTLDPALIRFCSANDYTQWVAAAQNTAGAIRMDSGSGIVAATKTRNGQLVMSTTGASMMQLTGDANVWAVNSVGSSTGPVGPNAAVDFNGSTYFMAGDNFMVYDGTLRVLACDVWNRVYGVGEPVVPGFNAAQQEKIYCHVNKGFNEIWWHYPSPNSSENDSYVAYNYVLNCWHYGLWSGNLGGDTNRSAGHDKSDLFNVPYMTYYNTTTGVSQVFLHETGYNANGQGSMGEYVESWDSDIMDNGSLVHVSHLLQDFKGPTGGLANGGVPQTGVAYLVHFDDTAGSTTFVDSSANNLPFAAPAGAAQSKTESVIAKFTNAVSVLGTANGNQATGVLCGTLPVLGGPLDLGAGDWTLQGQFYLLASPVNLQAILWECGDSINSTGHRLYAGATGQIQYQNFDQLGNWDLAGPSGAAQITFNAWHHWALVKYGTTLTLYVDGVPGTPRTGIAGIVPITPTATTKLTFGYDATLSSIQHTYWNGYLDEFQQNNGIALYTGAFTPPASPGTGLTTPQVQFTVKYKKYPGDAYTLKGPYVVVPSTRKISARGKGRQIAIRIGNSSALENGSGVYWSMGTLRGKCGEDGDR